MTDHEVLLGQLRPGAFAIAYRMLGSVAEAEDVVQEALLNVHEALEAGERLTSPRAYTATVTTRLAINQLNSARRRRERYVGPWLPEPILTDGRDDPAEHAQTADALSLALLVVLETLTPEQRAVFLLHDVFAYAYTDIARIIGTSVANARQLAARARRHVAANRPRFATTRAQRDHLAREFFAAAEHGDIAGLEALLAHDVELTVDADGKLTAPRQVVRGRARVAAALARAIRLLDDVPGWSLRRAETNGDPGALFLDAQGRLLRVWAIDVNDRQVAGVRSILNPAKLAHLGPVAGFRAHDTERGAG